MKRVTFIFLFSFIHLVSYTQDVNFEWAKQIGGTGIGGISNSITTDASGNVYTTGYFEGTVDFDPGPRMFNLTSGGEYDIFISKFDLNGNFIWAKQMKGSVDGSPNYTIGIGYAIAVDASGNVYTTGFFGGGTVDFDPGPGVFNLSTWVNLPYSESDIFISKLNAAGNFVWAKRIGTSNNNNDVAYSIAVDAAGNVYTTGSFINTVDFDPGPGVFNLSAAGGDIFICKLNPAGNFVWAKQMKGNSYGYSIAVDASGNVYTTGEFFYTVDFDPGPGIFNLTANFRDVFVSKLDAAGNFIWAKQLGGTSDEAGFSIAVDATGNVYSSGFFGGTVDFDPGPGVFDLSASSTTNIFISKLDASGNFIWAKQLGGGNLLSAAWAKPGSSYGGSISLDVTGNIYTTGSFSGTADFDPGPATYNLTTIDINGDMFVSKLDMNGNFIWAKQMGGGSSSYAGGNSIALDAFGNIFTTGSFSITVDFDPGVGMFNLTSIGATDIFVHKMSQCANSNTSSAITASTCSTYTLNGQTYSASGVYIQTISNAGGCDSIISLNLTVNKINTAINTAACKSYTWNNNTYTTSGSYNDTLVTANGCDSIVTLNLTISSQLFSTITQSICTGQSYYGYNASGTYIDTLIAVSGCDSIRTLQLTILPIPAPDLGDDKNLCLGDSLILYPGSFNTYNWYNGSTKSHLTVSQPGRYSVVVIDYCGSATDEITITEANCDIYFPSAFTPNNDGKNDWFRMLGGQNVKDFHLVVYNRWGQRVFETSDPANGWNGLFNGVGQSSATFVWYCEFNKPGNADKTKMQGTVTLIR